VSLGDVQFTHHGDILVAGLSGEIDLSNAEPIGEAIAETTSNRHAGLVLDLTALYYLDSAGIQLLFRLRERVRARGQSFALVIPVISASTDVLRLAGVTLHVEAFETLEEAVRSAATAQDQDATSLP
jgi:anti-anti-sigma factor